MSKKTAEETWVEWCDNFSTVMKAFANKFAELEERIEKLEKEAKR